ncbi:MAG: NifB/NifX family molybdenum-iron cluster-binding protein [Candidatus Aenigmarchaeota archaeon]|nr:NifB/NifX family molybdenum-iron cluster-binding protein [Candidatus Aenigmarchaeota archaeon]
MIIAVPTEGKKGMDEKVALHFGRCETYTLIDENGKLIGIIGNTSEHMGGVGLPPELLKKHGAEVLLCGDLGPRAIEMCKSLGIEVWISRAETVKEIHRLWKEGKAKKAGPEDACEEHRK